MHFEIRSLEVGARGGGWKEGESDGSVENGSEVKDMPAITGDKGEVRTALDSG